MIPDDAVEAAAFTVGEAVYGDLTPREAAQQILEAAAPHLIAAALREAADQLEYGNPINSWLYERAAELVAA